MFPSIRSRPVHACALAVASLALAGCAHHSATPEPGPAPAGGGPAISADDLRQRLFILANDSMLGRETGTAGNVKATNYIAAEAAKLGLRPAGENGTFFQTVPLIRRSTDPGTTLTVDGSPLVYKQDFVVVPPLAGALPLGLRFTSTGTPAVYGGRAGDSTAALSDDQIAGKVVVLDAPLGPDGRPAYRFWGRPGMTRYSKAAAIVVATLDVSPPQLVTLLTQPRTALADHDGDSVAGRPIGLIVTQAAAARVMGAPLASLQPGAVGRSVAGAARIVEGPTDAPARNVIAVYPGGDPTLKGEYVAIGGHSDHMGIAEHPIDHDSARAALLAQWRLRGLDPEGAMPTPAQVAALHVNVDSAHQGRAPRRDSVFNGADDDGSGSVSTLELARAFAKGRAHPRRSILFVWHTGEEEGLLGSRYFTDHPTVPRDSIVAQLNMDMVGRGGADDIKGGGPLYVELVGSRRLSTELGDIVEAVNKTEPQPLQFDYQFDANGHPENIYCRSDHYSYARYGIPIVFFTTGLHEDYHQVTDEPQYIDYAHMARVDRLVYDVAARVADLDHRVTVDKPKPDPHGQCQQ